MSRVFDDQCLYLNSNISIPSHINKHLKPCQHEVLRFLYTHYFQKDGGILSDKNESHDVLPLVVFIYALTCSNIENKFLIVINEENKTRLNLWLHYFSCMGVLRDQIKYFGKNESRYSSDISGPQPCIYLVKAKRFDDHLLFFKKIKWTLILYDNFGEKSSLTNMLNSVKDLISECRFAISQESIFHSHKYFWSLFKFIGKSSMLGKTWKEFDESGFKYHFNKADRTSDGKMSKMDIYKTLEATRIRLEYVSRSLECTTEDIHASEPWAKVHHNSQ